MVVAALACVYSAASHAQSSEHATASYGRGLGTTSLGQGNLSLGRNAIRERGATRWGNAAPPAAARHDVALTYTADPRLTEKIRVSMIDLASEKNPAARPQWEKAMARDGILQEFDNLMPARGYSRLNSPTTRRCCWRCAGRSSTTATLARRSSVAQMRSAAQTNPALRALPNAERQAMAESLAYQVMIMHGTKVSADRSGNQTQLVERRDSAESGIHLAADSCSDGFRVRASRALERRRDGDAQINRRLAVRAAARSPGAVAALRIGRHAPRAPDNARRRTGADGPRR
jgi:hypothetical protein